MKDMHIKFNQLQALIAVSDAGSFTGASEALGLTQSAISHTITSLETSIGVMLLVRDRSGVVPTDVGQRVLNHAREVLTRIEHIRQEATQGALLATGKVRIGTFPSVSARYMPGMLHSFRQAFPGIDVVLFEGTDQEVYEWICTSVVDVGVVTLPCDTLTTLPIAQDAYCAVVGSCHALATQPTIRLNQLARYPFIMSKAGCKPFLLRLFRSARLVPNVQFEILDQGTIVAMVREDMGVTIMPELALPDDRSGLHIAPLEPVELRHLALAVPTSGPTLPAVTTLLHHAQRWSQEHPL